MEFRHLTPEVLAHDAKDIKADGLIDLEIAYQLKEICQYLNSIDIRLDRIGDALETANAENFG